ncbi:MAG: MaoC family dehydratase N-terminal domain-containing protein [Ktedonobacterales bacterium]|nr:MaoC family dehydratase N-terminal domain-containing protein [Ktedonobacterales bacterium]
MEPVLDQSIVGLTSATEEFEVERGAIRRFAAAIGDPNPLYADVAHARACGYADLLAPPTFPTTFRVALPIALDASHTLHGEQEYRYARPIIAGDVIQCASTIRSVHEREGTLGKMTIIVAETTGMDRSGQPVFTGSSTIIVH